MDKTKHVAKQPSHTLALDAETGIISAYVSVSGVRVDSWIRETLQAGCFRKSIAERGPAGANRIRTLWQHDWNEVIGMPIELAEHSREQLPERILQRYPQATGGLFARTQFVMDVQRGREAVALYKAGAMDEWSIGFDIINSHEETVSEDWMLYVDEVRLWEYSPVTFGANPATATTEVRSAWALPGGETPEALAELQKRVMTVLVKEPGLTIDQLMKHLAASEAAAQPPEQALTDRDRLHQIAQLAERINQINRRTS
ncbi:MAG TPA: HK97 family phage prohead protease [Accumulibacter sp.]|uniref:HK97 family phage prohead protease n=1 Tax=Accumulibacter sp. TaxID=2053492 RepID=UPI002BD02A06|nr:HK97 family phage prohead protease [Accumulibacter sp.]HRF71750.1 HK97 family phage prohead protease [Accumulibacter sp.]